jgi:hypothetical protein
MRLGYYRYLEPEPVGARLAGDGALEDAIAGKPCSYRKRFMRCAKLSIRNIRESQIR